MISASSLYIAKKVLKRQQPWSSLMTEQTSYTEKQIRDCAKEICIVLNSAHEKQEYSSLYKKFSMAKYLEVAKINVSIA